MPCYSPLTAWPMAQPTKNGKMSLTFKKPEVGDNQPGVTIPCGQCIGCRLEKSRQWAIRCMHEAQLYEDNCFLTLTYSDENIPQYGSLDKSHYQHFMKRYRRFIEEYTWDGNEYKLNPRIMVWNGRKKIYEQKILKCYKKVRYFQCGEYGDETERPHYHAVVFNHDFHDKKLFYNRDDTQLFTSDTLTKLWGYGHCTIGAVTFESAAYVARYVVKKMNGEKAVEHYMRTDPITGEIIWLEPEYATMSRRPGIGREWYEKYKNEVYPSDTVVVRGREMKPPKYYDTIYEFQDVMEHFQTINERFDKIDKSELTPERLAVKKEVKEAQLTKLNRSL